jgi:hypothetical protein
VSEEEKKPVAEATYAEMARASVAARLAHFTAQGRDPDDWEGINLVLALFALSNSLYRETLTHVGESLRAPVYPELAVDAARSVRLSELQVVFDVICARGRPTYH